MERTRGAYLTKGKKASAVIESGGCGMLDSGGELCWVV